MRLGLPWGVGVDTFAVGCIIAELYLGENLFPHTIASDRERLAVLDRVLGPFPEQFAHDVEEKLPGIFIFDENGPTVMFQPDPLDDWQVAENEWTLKRLESMRPLSVRGTCSLEVTRSEIRYVQASMYDTMLYDLTRSLMALNPRDRITMFWAGKHKYFDRLSRLQWQ